MTNRMTIEPSAPVHGEEEKQAIVRASETWGRNHGEHSIAFENQLSEYLDAKHVTLVNSGSSANFVALMAMTSEMVPENRRLNQGDEVITAAMGFPTTVSPIIYAGAVPVFVDVEKGAGNINPEQVREMITDKTKIIMVAHTLGNPFNIDEIRDICEEHELTLIEDNCFTAETSILTIDGYIPIAEIEVGDMVMTSQGYKPVKDTKMTGKKSVIQKLGLVGTPDHPIITPKGVKTLDKLSTSDKIYVWNQKLYNIEEKIIKDIPILREDTLLCTIGMGVERKEIHYIDRYTGTPLEKSLKASLYTMRMVIPLTMILAILSSWKLVNTIVSTQIYQKTLKRFWLIWKRLERVRKNGMAVMKVGSGTRNMEKRCGRTKHNIIHRVSFAEKLIKLISQQEQNIVVRNAGGLQDVYNLTVEEKHEFVANNILVHNCDALGSEWNGKRTGTFGHIGTSSFYPAHHISTGEGGAVYTNNAILSRAIKSMVSWGRDCFCGPAQDNVCGHRYDQQHGDLPHGYDHKNTYTNFGFNFKMVDIQAAIGVEQMKRLDGFTIARRYNHEYIKEVFEQYKDWFVMPEVYEGANPSWFGYVVELSEAAPFTKRELELYLDEAGIKSRALFCGNITKQPVLSSGRFEYKAHPDLSVSDRMMENAFWIGVHPAIGEQEREYMKEQITNFMSEYL